MALLLLASCVQIYLNDEQTGRDLLFSRANFLRGGENACDIKGWKGLMEGHHVSYADIEILSTMRERIFSFFQ